MQTTQALAALARDRLRFRFMVEFSLFTLCLSLAPLFVLAFGIAEEAVWRSCSALLAVGAL